MQVTQEEQASLRAFIQTEHTALCDVVQERHDELRSMIAFQNQYFQDFKVYLKIWHDRCIS